MSKLSLMNADEAGLTKRQLGLFLVGVGAVGIVAILAVDVLDVGRQGGIGPMQTFALVAAAVVAAVGLTLLPLGDAPA